MALSLTVSLTIWVAFAYLLEMDLQTLAMMGGLALPLAAIGFAVAAERYNRRRAATELEMTLLHQAAHTDILTALGNRRAFQEELRREASRAARVEQPLSLALWDIDDFKAFNDARGHIGGDIILAEFAKAVMFLLRAEDRAFRIGGDEFAVLMPNTSAEGALSAIGRLKLLLQQGLKDITLSIGIATAEGAKVDPGRLSEQADSALYEAKRRGKDQIISFEDEPGLAEATFAKWEELRTVLSGTGPRIIFQPIYELPSRELIAYEALMRLPEGSLISGPLEAFEIAERIGLHFELDSLCLERAVATATSQLTNRSYLFINIDPRTLVHPSFSPDVLQRKVIEAGLRPTSVVLEVTERSTVPVDRLAMATAKLASLGFRLAIDDVGSGNSGLEMLRRIHFDYIKIDRSVVLDGVSGGPGKAVMMAIVAFAAQAGSFVIAEGIDSAAMLNAVELGPEEMPDLSIQAVQGFLFGSPDSPKQAPPNISPNRDAAA